MKLIIIFLLSLLLSCEKDQSYKYVIPHEVSETVVSLNPNQQAVKTISFDAPTHWISQPPSNMVLASFSIIKQNQSASLTILKFPGQTGGLIQNVNRWLNQLSLYPVQLSDLNQFVTNGTTANYKFQRVEITNEQKQKSMIVFIIRDKNMSWFFKMVGDTNLINNEDSTFLNFMNSVVLP